MIDTEVLQTLAQITKFSDSALLIDIPCIERAKVLVISLEDYLALWAKIMGKKATIIRSQGTEIIIPASIATSVFQPVENEIVTHPSDESGKLLWFANIAVSPALLTIANDLMNNPRKAGVVRLSDELQVIMSDGCKILNPGHTLQEATNWQRSQFWHPQDLIDFRRECQQCLTADGATTLEFRWRSFDPDLGIGCNEPGNWLEFATRYRLFDGGDGDFYQICDNLGMREIEPVTV